MRKAQIEFVRRLAARMLADEGQTLAEYGMLVFFIAIVVVLAAVFLGHQISALFVPIAKDFL